MSLSASRCSRSIKAASRAKVMLASGQSIAAEKVLVAVGRRAVCDKETIDALGLQMNGSLIAVNEKMETNVPGVSMPSAMRSAQAILRTAHLPRRMWRPSMPPAASEKMYDYNLIPRAVYSFPEVASVGMTEAQCAAKNMCCYHRQGIFPQQRPSGRRKRNRRRDPRHSRQRHQ